MTQKWLQHIEESANLMPFGKVYVELKRHRNQTTKVEISTKNTLKYDENDQVFADIERLLNNLIENAFTGRVQFEVEYKQGSIPSLTIKNTNVTDYRN